MKCYNHLDVDAVAICKNCQKGLCKDCAVDVGKGIACKEMCEQDVRAINDMIDRNQKAMNRVQSTSSRSHYVAAFITLLTGGAFIGYGIYSMIELERTGFFVFSIGLGIVFLIASVLYFSQGKKASRLFEN